MPEILHDFYQIKPTKLGCEVRGVDVKTENRPEVIEKIKQDVAKYRLLIFKDQGVVSGERQVEITKWFGEVHSTHEQHPKSPHPDVFRVSNDPEEGHYGIGRRGWHIGGGFLPIPFYYVLYHMPSVPKKGATCFAPLSDIIQRLPAAKRSDWDRLWMVSESHEGVVHPLIYKHPITKKEVLCFHLGMTSSFIYDYGTDYQRLTTPEETKKIIKSIDEEFVKDGGNILYKHEWEVGDFIMSDNLSVGHEASPESQIPRSEVGLRVLHRTTAKGEVPPSK
ncbi:hypothetical protein GE061_007228 [Apolygus lucorum]|uniref:TauD/TfdA-like domain-containing protein n=1 Tax=Apolygus lucorum TaxID=248454 RepID=A0A6A4IQY2_APOLU|nr:hypothetical protein GE061_007228 [Apolygus lucorum]